MITPTLPAVGDPTERGWAQAVIDALVDLNSGGGGGGGGGSSGSLLLNGSFEVDADADSEPDNWTIQLQTNGAFTLTGHSLADTACVSGARAIKFTSIGGGSNGGGEAQSDFFEVSPLRPLKVEWMWYCTSVSAANFVRIDFYDASQAFISPTITLWQRLTGIDNPSAWTSFSSCAIPPATARYAKLTLIGCDSSVPTACSTYFDGVSVNSLQFLRSTKYHGKGTSVRTWIFVPTVTGPHRITCIGGGGGGASRAVGSSPQPGGGSGAFAQSVINLNAGFTYAVVVGNGGAGGSASNGSNGASSTFAGSWVVAVGGGGGTAGAPGSVGAAGSTGSCTGDVLLPGMPGTMPSGAISGCGGPSVLGFAGGEGVPVDSDGAFPDAGSGGAGGSGSYYVATLRTGGYGGGGLVMIEW